MLIGASVLQLREAGKVEVDTAEMRRVRARLAARAEAEEELMARWGFLISRGSNSGAVVGVRPLRSDSLEPRWSFSDTSGLGSWTAWT